MIWSTVNLRFIYWQNKYIFKYDDNVYNADISEEVGVTLQCINDFLLRRYFFCCLNK